MPHRLREVLVATIAASPVWTPTARAHVLRALGVKIGAHSRVRPYLRFVGRVDLVQIGRGCFLNTEILIGSNAPVIIGDHVSIGPRVQLIPTSHRIGPSRARAGAVVTAPIHVGDGSWIGAGVIVLGGVSIGAGCVIAAGAVVTSDCADDGLYGGIPARLIRTLDQAAERRELDEAL